MDTITIDLGQLERLLSILISTIEGIENYQQITFAIDDLDNGFKVQIGNGPWSPPIYGTIER